MTLCSAFALRRVSEPVVPWPVAIEYFAGPSTSAVEREAVPPGTSAAAAQAERGALAFEWVARVLGALEGGGPHADAVASAAACVRSAAVAYGRVVGAAALGGGGGGSAAAAAAASRLASLASDVARGVAEAPAGVPAVIPSGWCHTDGATGGGVAVIVVVRRCDG